MNPELPLDLSPAVQDALGRGAPVVALESTIVTHGMPYPENVSTARAVEAAVRAGGAVPATIAVLRGRIRVGLGDGEIEALGRAEGVLKLSRADLAYALTAGRAGSTTVAATMICAHLAGIRVFATGGIGGVHRGVEATMDVSADLDELGRTPVAVVCAGAKALLDLPRTLEVLETRGVPVVGYRSDRFPAFWSRDSGLSAPLRLDTAAEIAALVAAQRRLGLAGGVLVANPVPEADEIPAPEIAAHIERAVAEATRRGVTGKAVTPFILSRMLELTDGRSLRTNVALILSNARLAAEIAAAMADRGGAGVEIRQDDPTAAHVADLLAFHLRELRGVMGEHAFALDAAGLSAPGVTFWTAWRGDALLGFAALKQLDGAHGEVKSMRAAPAARGTGVGRALLAHVVAEARRRGYARLSLETGTAALHAPAVSLYRSIGFVPCGAFAEYRPSRHNQFLELDLSV